MTQIVMMIELDALLDTRLGHLKSHYPHAFATLNKKAYYGRITDELELLCSGLPVGQFAQSYQDRGNLTLSNSLLTHLALGLGDLVYDAKMRMIMETGDPRPNQTLAVEINHYPYEISEELKPTLAAAISHRFPPQVPLSWVCYAPEQMTPALCKSRHWEVMILYHFTQWVEHHYGDPMHVPDALPNTTVIAPELAKGFESFKKNGSLENAKGEKQSAFEALKFTLYPFFMLTWLPSAEFSAFIATEMIDEDAGP